MPLKCLNLLVGKENQKYAVSGTKEYIWRNIVSIIKRD